MTTETASSYTIQPRRHILHNFLLLWIDANIDLSDPDYQTELAQLRATVDDVNVFTQRDECIDFLTDIKSITVTMIIDGVLCPQILPLIHDIPQLDKIYILCRNTSKHEKWTEAWMKVSGSHTQMSTICESLEQVMQRYKQNSIAMSFVPVDEVVSSPDLDQLDPTFMYTQLFKEIFLDMNHNQQSIQKFLTYCQNENLMSPTNITRFENNYNAQLAIWWYTSPTPVYSLLNTALRMLQANTIINMSFFICDLHHQITQLYEQQVGRYNGESFTIYRGQGLLNVDFDRLCKTNGGLVSFNNFLSTSEDRSVSLDFAKIASTMPGMVGILFQISVTPIISSAPFAAIREVSSLKQEEEILFSMHTVFRIMEIQGIENDDALYQVNLQLTADDDQQLRTLTHRIREEVGSGTGLNRLTLLLVKVGELDLAEELCNASLTETLDETKKVTYYNSLGYVKTDQGDYEKAIWYYKKALEIEQKTRPPNYTSAATSYNNLASVYHKMGKYSKALSFYEKVLLIRQKTLPSNHLDFATSYNNIAVVYHDMGEYSKALSFHRKALETQQNTLPSNHPDFATSYNNIALLYEDMREYSRALSFHQKALEIREKTLPQNHPCLAGSHNNIGMVYHNMGEYFEALSSLEKALRIQQKTLSPSHPSLATSYNNIASVYHKMGKYSKALSFFEKTLEIQQQTLAPNHLSLATSYNNIASVYHQMREYSKALSYRQKALDIEQKTFPPDHPDLATSYNNIASIYDKMKEYSKALSFHQKALEIREKTLPPNYPSLVASYNNIASVSYNMGDYSKALSFYERALNILKSSLPSHHPYIKTVQENIRCLRNEM